MRYKPYRFLILLRKLRWQTLSIEASTQEYVLSPDLNRDRFLQEINIQKDDLKSNLMKYSDLVNKYFPNETDLNESVHKNVNLYVQNSDRMVQLRQNSTLSAQPMRNITMEQDFQASEDVLFQSIDNAISHEMDEIADRSNAVDTAIKNSSLVTVFSTVISVSIAIVFGLYFSRYISRPISDLRQASIQIGKGDYENHFEHFERIDDWYLSNPDHNFADANIGPYNFLSSDIFKNLIYGDVFSRIDYHRGF